MDRSVYDPTATELWRHQNSNFYFRTVPDVLACHQRRPSIVFIECTDGIRWVSSARFRSCLVQSVRVEFNPLDSVLGLPG